VGQGPRAPIVTQPRGAGETVERNRASPNGIPNPKGGQRRDRNDNKTTPESHEKRRTTRQHGVPTAQNSPQNTNNNCPSLNKMIEDQEYEMQVCRAEVGVAKASYKPLADFIKKMGEAQSKAIHVISQVFELGGE